jgi:hypothetical protein
MHARLTQLHPKMKLREHFDYVRLAACGWYMVFKLLNCFFDKFYNTTEGECYAN